MYNEMVQPFQCLHLLVIEAIYTISTVFTIEIVAHLPARFGLLYPAPWVPIRVGEYESAQRTHRSLFKFCGPRKRTPTSTPRGEDVVLPLATEVPTLLGILTSL